MRKILLPLILAGITLFATACGENEEYGLCFISSEGTADINGDRFYPMHSIVKFPQALYVSDYMQTNGVSLDSMVVIRKAELMQDIRMTMPIFGKSGISWQHAILVRTGFPLLSETVAESFTRREPDLPRRTACLR